MKISLAILTLNEIVGVKYFFDKIPFSEVDEVLVVDGGSSDGTVEFFLERKIMVHRQRMRGRGEAFREAFEASSGEAIIFFSPDGNEDPGDIGKFREYLEAGSDMVIATRMAKGAHNEEDDKTFRWRKWANQAFTLLANFTWNKGEYVTDTINGFRAITRMAWSRLKLDGHGYTIEYQSSIRGFKLGLKITEFPTHEAGRIDENRPGSPSVKTGLAFLRLFFRELF